MAIPKFLLNKRTSMRLCELESVLLRVKAHTKNKRVYVTQTDMIQSNGKTKIIKKKKNPVWNAAFNTNLHYGHVDLRFEVYDWDAIGKHTFLGLVNIDANEAAHHNHRAHAPRAVALRIFLHASSIHGVAFLVRKDVALKSLKVT